MNQVVKYDEVIFKSTLEWLGDENTKILKSVRNTIKDLYKRDNAVISFLENQVYIKFNYFKYTITVHFDYFESPRYTIYKKYNSDDSIYDTLSLNVELEFIKLMTESLKNVIYEYYNVFVRMSNNYIHITKIVDKHFKDTIDFSLDEKLVMRNIKLECIVNFTNDELIYMN